MRLEQKSLARGQHLYNVPGTYLPVLYLHNMPVHKNILLPGPHQLPLLTDIFLPDSPAPAPVLLYAHGFNGFKDWGNFDLIAERFREAGFVCIKFNFSHNGTSPEQPEDFVDLKAYSENNYSIELDDLGAMIDWATSAEHPFAQQIDKSRVGLIGHSLGGGIVLLKAAEDARVKAVATWAAISKCQTPWGNWPKEKMEDWQRTGVAHITNGRTGQEMPLGYQLVTDFQQNRQRLDMEAAVKSLKIPLLICHGTADPAVPFESARKLHSWKEDAQLFSVESDHVFGRRHPWPEASLPEATQVVVSRTILFFQATLEEK